MNWFGTFILKHSRLLSAAVFLISGAAFFFMPELRIEEDESMWFEKDDPILQTYHRFQEEYASDETAVVAFNSEDVLAGKELAYIRELSDKLEKLPNVEDILSLTTVNDIRGTSDGLEIKPIVQDSHFTRSSNPGLAERVKVNHLMQGTLVSANHKTAGILLEFKWDKGNRRSSAKIAHSTVEALEAFLKEESERSGRRFFLGGNLITDFEVADIVDQDMHRFFPLSVLLAAILVLFIFKRFLHVVFPVLSVVFALLWTLTLQGLFDSPITPVSTTLFALINVIGIANAIHLISHYTIAFGRLGDKKAALLETFRIAGKACFFTSFTTALGFGSLCISRLPVIRDMGMYAAFGIMSAFLISMILVPAGLLLIREKKSGSNGPSNTVLGEWLERTATFDLNRPYLIMAAFFVMTAVMTGGIFLIRTESSMVKYLKSSSSLRMDAEYLDTAMAGISSIEVIIKGREDDFKDPDVLRGIEGLQRMAEGHGAVTMSHSLVDYTKLIYRALMNDSQACFAIPDSREMIAQELLLYEMSGGDALGDYVSTAYDETRVSIRVKQMSQDLRESLLADIGTYIKHSFPGFTFEITGFDNLIYQTTNRIVETEIRSISLALGVILVTMCFLFGIRGGLVSILPNIFPIAFMLGFMGYFGYALNVATSIIASIAIGIVVDDTIHYFSHYRHELEISRDRKLALRKAHRTVGSALCFTSVSLVMGFSIFLFSSTHILIDYGLLSGIAVIMALLGDLYLGPALLFKLGVFKKKDEAAQKD